MSANPGRDSREPTDAPSGTTAYTDLLNLLAEKVPAVKGIYDSPVFAALSRVVYGALATPPPYAALIQAVKRELASDTYGCSCESCRTREALSIVARTAALRAPGGQPAEGSAVWMVVRKREIDPVEVWRGDEANMRRIYEGASLNWSECYLVRVIAGPGDVLRDAALRGGQPPEPSEEATPSRTFYDASAINAEAQRDAAPDDVGADTTSEPSEEAIEAARNATEWEHGVVSRWRMIAALRAAYAVDFRGGQPDGQPTDAAATGASPPVDVQVIRDAALEEAALIADEHWPESGHDHSDESVSCAMSISILIRRLKSPAAGRGPGGYNCCQGPDWVDDDVSGDCYCRSCGKTEQQAENDRETARATLGEHPPSDG